MPGEFTVTGAAWKLVADSDDDGAEDLAALSTMTEGMFVCNIPPNVAVPVDGGVMFIDTRPFTVLDDGQISEDGTNPGIVLLANDPSNGIEGVQWTIKPGRVLIGGRVRSLRAWTFDAPGPGEAVSLETLTPTPSVDPGGGGGGGGTPDDGSVTFAKFAASAIVTEAETIAAHDNDVAIPTSAAVKAYVDTSVSGSGITAAAIHAATSKTTPVDADEFPVVDSAASFGLKKATWSAIKATLKTYFDSLATTLTSKTIALGSNTITGSVSDFNTALTGADFYTSGGTDVALADGGTGASLTDPNADRIMFWDDSTGAVTWLTLGTNLSITGTTIDATGGGGGSGDMVLATAQTVTGAKTFNKDKLLDKGSEVFNVRAYGAVGNGTTVDTTAFTSAISAASTAGGGIVYVPPGTYKVGGVALATGITLRGAGMGATVLKMDHTGSDTLVVRVSADSTTAANRVGLEYLTIDGDKATLGSSNTSTRYGYYMGIEAGTAVTDCWVDHCEFKNCKTYALDILEVSRITVTSSVSHDNGYTTGTGNNCSGFESHADDVLFSNCNAYSNGNHGFIIGNGTAHKRSKVMNCIATGNAQSGIMFGDATTDSSIVGCTSHTNTKWGIYVGPNAHRNVIDGCTIYANTWQAIDLESSNNCVVVGNSLNGNSSSGFDDEIKLEGTTTATLIVGNQITTASTNKAIHEYDTVNGTVIRSNVTDRASTLIGSTTTTFDGGDASTNTATSVDSEVALFSGTAGKTLKRATGSGLAKLTSGVLGTATAGTDYVAPGGTDIPVADGGTGRSTSTTAYGLIAAGTTATGAHQTLAAGATTDVLVGGGASALPAWTTATGSGAPVRATSPTLITPVLGTPASGNLANCTALPVAGITASTASALGVGTVELGHASDTTLSRSAAGKLAVEGVDVVLLTGAQTLVSKTLTAPTLTAPVLGTPASGTLTNCTGLPVAGIAASTATALGVGSVEVGHASDTTITRSEAGLIAVEGVVVPTITGAKRIAVVSSIPGSPDPNTVYIINDSGPRITTITSSATPTINTDNCDAVTITALAAAITSMTTNLSGTPKNFQKLMIRIKDDGTLRAIAWGASFEAGTVALPTTTVAGKTLLVGLMYDAVDAKWACEATGSRA